MDNPIHIIDFAPSLAPSFAALNKAWLQKYFEVEPLDEAMLANPKAYIIDNGGHIFFAAYKGAIAGTFALIKVDATTYELSKMAVDENYQGLKIGNALMQAALEKAAALKAEKVVLLSNTRLLPAIHLYKKYGFREVPLGATEYKRANIKMEKELK